MPPSLLMLAAMASGVVIGRGTSLPTSDHVPELMISASSGFATGAAAKALAVSCDAHGDQLRPVRPDDSASGLGSAPTTVAGRHDLGHDPRRDPELP